MFIANNRDSFHLWWKENLVKHQKVSKYYDQYWERSNLIGFPIDEPEKPVELVLALMIVPLVGQQALVARLIPMISLKADF